MNFTLERITDPDIEPVTIDEMIQHVREFSSIPAAPRANLTALITAGREWAEDYTGRALIEQSWRLTIHGLPYAGRDAVRDVCPPYGYYFGAWTWRVTDIPLRKAPVLAITSVKSVDSSGTVTTVDANTYALREAASKWPRMVALNGATWAPGYGQDLRIEFRAGFADRLGSPQQGAEMVPERFKQAIKMWAEANYDRDEKLMQKLLDAAEAILKPERAELQIA